MFSLDPQLSRDTFPVGDLPLCRVLLMNDAQYPWLILVPRRASTTEIFQLTEADQQLLARESAQVAAVMHATFAADKMNVAALGNVVAQLHVHHVARFRGDPAWPKPVWGAVPARPYNEAEAAAMLQRLRAVLGHLGLKSEQKID